MLVFQLAVLGKLLSSLLLLPTLELSPPGVSAAPLPAAGPLNVRDFGAVGTGTVDDGPAIQKAIDAAQDNSDSGGAGKGMGRAVYFPSGTYLINKTLTVANTHEWDNHAVSRPVRLFGDGMLQSKLIAGAPMDAVLRVTGSITPAVPDTISSGHIIENLQFSAALLANYSVAAPAITRSQARYCMFVDARVAGLVMNGWINEIFECHFKDNLVGLHLGDNLLSRDTSVNSVNVIDGNFERNYGVGLIVNSGVMVRIEGNCFEAQGGPAIIASNVGALTLRSNYFEENNRYANQSKRFGFVGHASGQAEAVCTDILVRMNTRGFQSLLNCFVLY